MRLFLPTLALICTFWSGSGCGASTTGIAGTSEEQALSEAEKETLCARVCQQQHRCDGESANDETLVHCANACFRSVQERSELSVRLRVLSACLDQGCGPVLEQCLAREQARMEETEPETVSAPTPDPDPEPASSVNGLSPSECQTVCEKTLECLGASETDTEAVQACIVGCSETPNVDAAAIRKLRNVLRCVSAPCGASYRECMRPSD